METSQLGHVEKGTKQKRVKDKETKAEVEIGVWRPAKDDVQTEREVWAAM